MLWLSQHGFSQIVNDVRSQIGRGTDTTIRKHNPGPMKISKVFLLAKIREQTDKEVRFPMRQESLKTGHRAYKIEL